jgi:hypothetical protein
LAYFSTLMLEASCSCEASVDFQRTTITGRHTSEDRSIPNPRGLRDSSASSSKPNQWSVVRSNFWLCQEQRQFYNIGEGAVVVSSEKSVSISTMTL